MGFRYHRSRLTCNNAAVKKTLHSGFFPEVGTLLVDFTKQALVLVLGSHGNGITSKILQRFAPPLALTKQK